VKTLNAIQESFKIELAVPVTRLDNFVVSIDELTISVRTRVTIRIPNDCPAALPTGKKLYPIY
jgi:hypothetical protein